MEIANVELKEVQKVVTAGDASQVDALTELELVLVGGGCGDISLG